MAGTLNSDSSTDAVQVGDMFSWLWPRVSPIVSRMFSICKSDKNSCGIRCCGDSPHSTVLYPSHPSLSEEIILGAYAPASICFCRPQQPWLCICRHKLCNRWSSNSQYSVLRLANEHKWKQQIIDIIHEICIGDDFRWLVGSMHLKKHKASLVVCEVRLSSFYTTEARQQDRNLVALRSYRVNSINSRLCPDICNSVSAGILISTGFCTPRGFSAVTASGVNVKGSNFALKRSQPGFVIRYWVEKMVHDVYVHRVWV